MIKSICVIGSLFFASIAFAEELTIATGKVGGGYDNAAKTLATRLGQRSFNVNIQNLNGSDEITLSLCNGSADVGFTQVDAMDARYAEGCSLKPVGTYGTEVAVILFPPNSDYKKLGDLDASSKVLVDTVGSGSDLTWRTMVRIENGEHGNKSDWSKATPINDLVGLAQTLADFGDIHAVVLVRKQDSADITNLLENGWTLGDLYDKDINDYEFNGKPLYNKEKLKIKAGRKNHKGSVYEVKSFIVVTPELASDRQKFSVVAGSVR